MSNKENHVPLEVEKKLAVRSSQRNNAFTSHGQTLPKSLQLIVQTIEGVSLENSIIDTNLMIFGIELSKEIKAKDQVMLLESASFDVKVVKNANNALVALTKKQIQVLTEKIDTYIQSGV